jgi:hypothetical protein
MSDPSSCLTHGSFQGDKTSGNGRVVTNNGINAWHTDISAYRPLVFLSSMKIIDDGLKNALRQFLNLPISHSNKGLLNIVWEGRRSKSVSLVSRFLK